MLIDRNAARVAKFSDPERTAAGDRRAEAPFAGLRTLWFNTGTLCNIACANCYIESSPLNDRLVYLSAAEVAAFLDEASEMGAPLEEVGFTGGEPFMNRELPGMVADALSRGLRVLVLTNAMKPMHQRAHELAPLLRAAGDAFAIRVSIDHYEQSRHEEVRGPGTWAPMLAGLRWLVLAGAHLSVACRALWGESELDLRKGFGLLFAQVGAPIDALDPARLVLFPEMDVAREVPEISTRCWGILGVDPSSLMCASSRMIVKRKGRVAPEVAPCTLLPYEENLLMGESLAAAERPVKLNHPFCAQFCVLGGARCSAA